MRMVKLTVTAVVMLFVAGSWTPASAQKTACKDIQTRWFIYPVATLADGTAVASAISGDGSWYSGGSNTVIHVCGTNPTYDATMLTSTKRKVKFFFGAPLTGSVVSESIAGGTYQDSPFMNVRNILCVGCADPSQPFTTRMGMRYNMNNADYRLRFFPFVTDSPDRHTDPATIPAENTPYDASPVLVIPQAYDCKTGGATKPSWIVRGTNPSADPDIAPGENLQVGTLGRVTRTNVIHAGQYSMPFEIRIEALSCF